MQKIQRSLIVYLARAFNTVHFQVVFISFLTIGHLTSILLRLLRTTMSDVVRAKETKPATRQLTLTGKLAPMASSSSKSSSRKSKSSTERVYTDVLLSIRPEFTDLIAKREKNYEYRAYKLRDTVVRIWLYTVAPIGAIT